MMIELGGMQLHYDVHGDGEPLLWLHGGMGHGPDWRFIFNEPPAGYRLIAPDLRGHGRSTGAGPFYSFKQSAVDAFALLDHLQIDRVSIIGVSGGGISALHMATLQQSRVGRLVVISAPPAFPEQAKAIQRNFSDTMLAETERARMRERHARPGQLETLIAQTRQMPNHDDPNFSHTDLAAITADTLIVFGDRDFLYPISAAVELREAIPRSWLWVVPGGGHGPVFGVFAPAFVRTTLAFLAGRYSDLSA